MKGKLVQLSLAVFLLFPAVLVSAQDQNLLPKYGSVPKSEALKAADKVFVEGMDQDYHGDRTKASEFMALRGWQYLQQGDLDEAMRRFNQAWLLRNDNGTALWGMAAVESSKGQFDESLKLFAEADKIRRKPELLNRLRQGTWEGRGCANGRLYAERCIW